MRLIDADALLKQAQADGAYGYVSAQEIADAPTIEAAPAVHGKRIGVDDCVQIGAGKHAECSICGVWTRKKSNYCPRCGAKMDAEE